jgi:methylated-DNA-[protein]-cysteine S-methyltransferase
VAASNKALVLLRDELDTPLGRLVIITEESGALRLVGFRDDHPRVAPGLGRYASDPRYELRPASNPGGASQALRRYFGGDLAAIDALSVASIGTPFQQTVWRALRAIDCGSTLSYSALARRIRNPNAVRAVGLANGANPVCIVVPCHRVIGTSGALTGYGGGLHRKRWLLAHERALPELDLPFESKERSSAAALGLREMPGV